MRVDRDAAQVDEWGKRFYTYFPSRADLFAGTDLILSKGGSSFTSASLTADGEAVSGEYVTFDDEPGIYLLSSSTTPFTFTPAYYGENKTQKDFAVRPWQTTQKLVLVDEDEERLQDRTVQVYYWRLPVPLYRRSDIIMLPSVEYLKLRVLRSLPEAKSLYPVSERMLDDAKANAVSQNHKFSRVMSPRDKHGERYEMGTSPFKSR